MATYRSRHTLALGSLTGERMRQLALPRTRLGRRGYRPEDVHALLDRLAYEVSEQSRRLAIVSAENHRLKQALRTWQSTQR